MLEFARQLLILLMLLAVLPCAPSAAQQLTAQQGYRVRVPASVSINATNALAQIVHDETNDPQEFGWQAWQVVCNSRNGATMTMETDQAFTHVTNPTAKRNVFLWLTGGQGVVGGSGGGPGRGRGRGRRRWTITQEFGVTDYANGNEVATVEAETGRASDAEFFLRVSFLEEDFSTTIAGDYECTVRGTIVPK